MSTELSTQDLDQVIALQILACLHAEITSLSDAQILCKANQYEIFARRSFLWGTFKISKQTVQIAEEKIAPGVRTLLRPSPSIERKIQSRIQMHLENKTDFFEFVKKHTKAVLNESTFMKNVDAIRNEIRMCRERDLFRNVPGNESQREKSDSYVVKMLQSSTFVEDNLHCFLRLFKGQTMQSSDGLQIILAY